MASIAQTLFSWQHVDAKDDLNRLKLVMENIPDESLMRRLELERGGGRDEYPVRAVWNSLLAGVVFQHPSIASLRRELLRNASLRQACGFDVVRGMDAVPSASSYSRFLASLMRHRDEVGAIFESLVESLYKELPGFGRDLAIDGMAIDSHARRRGKHSALPPSDGRRDIDADIGVKKVIERDTYKEVKSWFGYKLHLMIDARYELPVARSVTKASRGEQPEAHLLVDHVSERHPYILDDCEHFIGDRGYDGDALSIRLWDDHDIKPVIDKRDNWKSGETRRVGRLSNVVYDQRATVYCYPRKGERKRMAYGGFEKDRDALKYLCPAKHYGCECPDRDSCPVKGSARIYLNEDRRIFKPLPYSSYKWDRIYARRSSVERTNSRLDGSFGLEKHFIRGLNKMRLKVDLALIVMSSMALGQARENRMDCIRSLTQVA